MKKFLFLLSVLTIVTINTAMAATPPVPTSADDLIKQYNQEKQKQQQAQPQKPQQSQNAQPPKQQPAQKPSQSTSAQQAQSSPEKKGSLSIDKLEEKLESAVSLIKAGNYVKAEQMLGPLSEWLTDSTEYHILLLDTLKDLPDAQYQTEIERAFAVKSALLRDKSLFYYGIALMNNKKDQEAARNFILVVQSQPKSKLGFDAYTRLQMLGFTQKVQFKHLEDVVK